MSHRKLAVQQVDCVRGYRLASFQQTNAGLRMPKRWKMNKSDTPHMSGFMLFKCLAFNYMSVKYSNWEQAFLGTDASVGEILHLLRRTTSWHLQAELKFWATQSIKPPTRGGDHKQGLLQAEAKWIFDLGLELQTGWMRNLTCPVSCKVLVTFLWFNCHVLFVLLWLSALPCLDCFLLLIKRFLLFSPSLSLISITLCFEKQC